MIRAPNTIQATMIASFDVIGDELIAGAKKKASIDIAAAGTSATG
jgi:hypothetical protein